MNRRLAWLFPGLTEKRVSASEWRVLQKTGKPAAWNEKCLQAGEAHLAPIPTSWFLEWSDKNF